MIDSEVAQENNAGSIDVPVKLRCAIQAVEDLGSTQTMVDVTTTSTCLAGVLFCAQDDLTPRVFTCLVDEMLAEAVV